MPSNSPQAIQARKAAAKRRKISAPGRRYRAVKESPWTTYELLRQAYDHGLITKENGAFYRAKDEAGEILSWGQDVRTYIAWQISDHRICWGLPDPIHPSEKDNDE